MLNGIVENYLSLRAELQAKGHVFTSETDAEVVAHLIERAYQGSLREAVVDAYRQMEGHFTYCAIAVDEPDVIVGVRKETPLVVGLGEGENFLASAIPAFLAETRSVIFPEDGEIVVVGRDGVEIYRPGRRARSTGRSQEVDWDEEAAEKAGYETFMLKEIHEQPTALADTLAERIGPDGGVVLDGLGLDRRGHPRPSTRWSSWPAAPRITPAWWASTRSSAGRACRWRSRWPRSSATATR